MWRADRAGRPAAALACVVLLLAGGVPVTEGYEFLMRYLPAAELRGAGEEWKPRWDPAVWGPGETLTVAVVEDPRWLASDSFGSMADVRAAVSEALRRWEAVGTADIRWRVAEAPAIEPPPWELTGIWLRLNDDSVLGRAWVGARNYVLDACEVFLDVGHVEQAPYRSILLTLTHELGHCLGLAHPPRSPSDAFPRWLASVQASLWGYDPIMSYGTQSPDVRLQVSDRIGASLLRPAPGWLETTGTIYGTALNTVSAIGAADPQRDRWDPTGRQVLVILIARIGPDGRLGEAVMRYTNRWGQFTIEGLPAGAYAVMVSNLEEERSRERVIVPTWGSVLLRTVEVRSGERTGPLVLTAHRRDGE